MASRRLGSARACCTIQRSSICNRHFTISKTQRLETAALTSANDALLSDSPVHRPSQKELEQNGFEYTETGQEALDRFREQNIQDNLVDLEKLWKTREMRRRVLRSLSNPWPEPKASVRVQRDRIKYKLPEANAGPIAHAVFRQRLKEAYDAKTIRTVLRRQLLQCDRPREIFKVIAAGLQDGFVAEQLVTLHEPITRAAYRCRAHVSDLQVLNLLNAIVWRFGAANLRVVPDLLHTALKFAARSRSLGGMKKYLRLVRQSGAGISSHIFRAVVAKFSIGLRGLGEIRNGRWNRDELLQVLNGFDDAKHLPPEEQYHLGTFLDRSDWHFLHGWVAVLARCKDVASVWREWQLWKQADARIRPKLLLSARKGFTSKVRGDQWFIEQMAHCGDYEKAWKILAECGTPFGQLKEWLRMTLLESLEHAIIEIDDLPTALLHKYDLEISRIEQALGVKWIPSNVEGEGAHELVEDQEVVLERLGSDDWRLDQPFGFPKDSDEGQLCPPVEMALHEAKEKGLASSDNSQWEE